MACDPISGLPIWSAVGTGRRRAEQADESGCRLPIPARRHRRTTDPAAIDAQCAGRPVGGNLVRGSSRREIRELPAPSRKGELGYVEPRQPPGHWWRWRTTWWASIRTPGHRCRPTSPRSGGRDRPDRPTTCKVAGQCVRTMTTLSRVGTARPQRWTAMLTSSRPAPLSVSGGPMIPVSPSAGGHGGGAILRDECRARSTGRHCLGAALPGGHEYLTSRQDVVDSLDADSQPDQAGVTPLAGCSPRRRGC